MANNYFLYVARLIYKILEDMKILNKIAFIVSLLLLLGCIKETDLLYMLEEQDSSVISFSIESFSSVDIASTKASGNNALTIHRGFLFFFSGDEYKGHEEITSDEVSGNGTSSISIIFDDHASYSNDYNIICVFNYDSSVKYSENYDFSGITKNNVSSYFPMDRDFLEKVEDDMNSGTYSVGMPMYTNDFADDDTAIHEIYRAVARISLEIADDIVISNESADYTFNAADITYAIVNDASSGSIGFESLDVIASTTTTEASYIVNETASPLAYPYIPVGIEDESRTTMAYLYEFAYSTMMIGGMAIDSDVYDSGRFSVILTHKDELLGTTLYYKLNLVDKDEDSDTYNNYLDIVRNHDYHIVINDVDSRGYTTLQEAYDMPPSNIDYVIYDDQGGVTLSNGQYAISMDEVVNYDNIQIYGRETTTLEFNNICYILPSEMDEVDLTNLTNSVTFSINNAADSELTITTTLNEFAEDPTLTDQGRSIHLEIEGEGSAEITLLIKLGNLEIGRETITINKVGEDGALDAHPCQIYLTDQQYVANSWSSTDTDFGAWYDDSKDHTVVYMGHNATPTGYRTMDGYISSSSSDDSYPIFSEKTRTGYYSYYEVDDDGSVSEDVKKTMIVVTQLAPFYVGHFGSYADEGSPTYYNTLIAEKIEEIENTYITWETTDDLSTGGVMTWAPTASSSYVDWETYPDVGSQVAYYNNIYSNGAYNNLVAGNTVSTYIAETYSRQFTAARYCYMKNDINGDGIVDKDNGEPVKWYLPSQNQALGMWINREIFTTDIDAYDLNGGTGDQYVYYWTCTENDPWGGTPSDFTQYVIGVNILEGEMEISRSKVSDYSASHVRCVRGVEVGVTY